PWPSTRPGWPTLRWTTCCGSWATNPSRSRNASSTSPSWSAPAPSADDHRQTPVHCRRPLVHRCRACFDAPHGPPASGVGCTASAMVKTELSASESPRHRRIRRTEARMYVFVYAFLLPTIVLYGLFTVYPIVGSYWYSFL